ncbi:cadherin domain-containing protein [Candidatus Puniceispirillum marinum]|uniref:Autotransporter-associated beta strand repeat protein n=1 Tax=Puniceispirillum marinum (strain IMCC1322) TaxID=488538 RepID=D5BMF4_PUNMI|nr:cadherin domain-containing protein [Candidatus Puniceispirillum marinum]ADE39997.1 autotransporter-associated beta strand repeat protein [Candidatus Puniceispirillum marinum IMCC1322]
MPFVSTNSARFDTTTNAYQLTIAENSAVGTLIGRIAFEGESGAVGSVYFNKSGADAAKIRIEPDGSIYVASDEPLNYEAVGGPPVLDVDFSVLFIGSDGSVEQSATSGSRVATTDVDEGPTLRVEVETDPFDEHVVDRNGITDTTAFASLTGEDEDDDTVTYSLSGDHAGLFHVVDNEVRLKDVTTFDFETLGPSIDLTVTAASTGAGGGRQTTEQTITITINDVNEPIIWNHAPKTFTLAENSNASTPVGSVSAQDGDGDPVSYSMSGEHADKFDIDRDTGAITVKTGAVLDYEEFAATNGVFTFQVHAAANGPEGRTSDEEQTVTINLTDLNEPTGWNHAPRAFTLAENSVGGTPVGAVSARDGDGDPVTYSLTNTLAGKEDNEAGKFQINTTTGAITVRDNAVLDYEAQAGAPLSFKVVAIAEGPDGRTSRAEQEVTVTLSNVNEPISWNHVPRTFTIAENSTGNTPVGAVTARDGDGDPITYTKSGDDADKFDIDRDTGAITVRDNAVLDYEAQAGTPLSFTVIATASGADGRISTSEQQVTVHLSNVNEPIIWNHVPKTFTLAENSNASTPVGSVSAQDGDGDPVTYSMSGDHADKFDIDRDTGAITVRKGAVLDYEAFAATKGVFTFQVHAAANGPDGRTSNSSQTVTIDLTDLNEPTGWNHAPKTFTLAENSNASTPVGAVSARDGDGDPVSYSLSGVHADKFDIDRDTGVITVKKGAVLDYEGFAATNGVFTFQVHATANGPDGRTSSGEQTVTIDLTNIDEPPTFVDAAGQVIMSDTAAVDEGQTGAGLAALATLRAVDPDGDPVLDIYVTSHANLFHKVGDELRLRPTVELDYENLPDDAVDGVIPVRVTAVSRKPGQLPKLTHMTVNVEVGDVGPIDSVSIGTAEHPNIVQVDAAVGDVVGRVAASSPTGDAITYGLTNADSSVSRYFTIGDDGTITMKAGITDPVFLLRGYVPLTVTASAGGESESRDITIQVNSITGVHTRPFPSLAGRTKTVQLDLPSRDGDGDLLHFVPTNGMVTTANGGRYSVAADGTLTYTARAGFEGYDNVMVTYGDSRGGTSQIRMEFDVSLPTVTVVEGQSQTVTWDLLNLAGLADPSGSVRFTTLPTRGTLQVKRGENIVDVTTSMDISAADIAGGRLTYRAEANFDDAHWQTAGFTLTHQGDSRSGNVAIAVRDFDITDLQHIDDSQDSRYELKNARDVKFIDIGDRTFLLATGGKDDGVTVFEFNPATKRLTFTDSISDNTAYTLNSASVMVHVEKNGRHFVYVSGNEDDGITRFTLTSDGELEFENTPGAVVRNSQDSRYTMDGGRSLTLVQFDNADYLIAAGNSDTGYTVFRIADNGDLNFVRAVTAPVTGDNGQSLSLGSLWGGIAAEAGGQTYFVIGSETNDSLFVYRMASDGDVTLTDTLTDTSSLELDHPRFGDSFSIGGRTFLTVAAGGDDGFGIYELSAAGRLSVISSIRDSARLELDSAWDSKAFTLDGQTFIVTTGHNDDGFSIFLVQDDGTPRFLRSVADNNARQLDRTEHVFFTRADDGDLVMAVAGWRDHGISLFEIDLDDPDAANPLLTPMPEM